jgi:DNA-binding SARP family transcriptional activator
MDAKFFFYLIQTIAVGTNLTLAVYVAIRRSSRKLHIPFIAFSLILAFDAYSLISLSGSDGTSSITPIILRFRWASLTFLPSIFLHMFTPLIPERFQNRARILTILTLGCAIITSIYLFNGNELITGIVYRGIDGIDFLEPIFNLTGIFLIALWVLPILAIATLFIIRASRPSNHVQLRADAKLFVQPWVLILLSVFLRWLAGYLTLETSHDLIFVLVMLEKLALIAVSLLLARGVLRVGAPIGNIVDSQLSILIIPLAVFAIIDFYLVYDAAILSSQLYLIRLLLISIIAGAVFARPKLLQGITRWIDPTPRDDADFTVRLSLAWESLAVGTFNVTQVSETILALQNEISANYVGVLEAVEIEDQGVQTFGRYDDGPRLTIDADHMDWPLTKETLEQVKYQISGIPGPPSIILPIHDDLKLAGILLIGKTRSGSEYERKEIQAAHLLTNMLSLAMRRGFLIQETPDISHKIDIDSLPLPDVDVVIRTFGSLEVFTRFEDPTIPRPSLRARQILAILLSTYPDPVAAETLMEQLWPEQPLGPARNSLYVAVYNLRRCLEPGLKRGETSQYIHRDGDYYRLDINDSMWVDFLSFLEFYWSGKNFLVRSNERRARRSFERAVRMCRRSFLSDATLDLPSEVEVTRHRLHRFMHEMVWYLTDHYIQKENWAEAERVLLHLISIDHHDHEARDTLAKLYQRQGKEGLAKQVMSLGKEDLE